MLNPGKLFLKIRFLFIFIIFLLIVDLITSLIILSVYDWRFFFSCYCILALPPEIVEPPKDKQVVDGKTVKLTCRVFGAPKPEVKWDRQGVELTGGRFSVLPEGDLEIRCVSV